MRYIQSFRHPGYNISRGTGSPQYVIHDIATIKVDTTNKPMTFLKPACLPTSEPPPPKEQNHSNFDLHEPLLRKFNLKII